MGRALVALRSGPTTHAPLELGPLEVLLSEATQVEIARFSEEEVALVDPAAGQEQLNERDLAVLAATYRSLEARELLTPGEHGSEALAHGPLATVVAIWSASDRIARVEIGTEPIRESRTLFMLPGADLVMQDAVERGVHTFTLQKRDTIIAEVAELIVRDARSDPEGRREVVAEVVVNEKTDSAGAIDEFLRDSLELSLVDVGRRFDDGRVARVVVTFALRADGLWLVAPVPRDGRATIVARPLKREDVANSLRHFFELPVDEETPTPAAS